MDFEGSSLPHAEGILSRFFKSSTKVAFLVSAVFSAQSAIAAAPQYALPNRYVVEFSNSNQSTAAAMLSGPQGAHVIKRFQGNAAVISKDSMSAASVESKASNLVPYDANDPFCIDLVKKHLVASCSQDFIITTDATPNDPDFARLWGLSANSGINMPAAWDVATGTRDVVVAVIDTGADYTHRDLANNMWVNSGEIAGNGIDDDGNGYVDDVYGIDTANGDSDPMDDNGHGTHVSGTIGAVGNNSLGLVGINWDTRIMPLKFLSASGAGALSGAITAIDYAVSMKRRGVPIRVINASWGGGGYSQALYNAISRLKDLDIIFVAAAGNEANDNDANPSYPATYDLSNIVSVAAIDPNHNIASFSNYGAATVDIAAPGTGILSTYPGNSYRELSGTSMATPHVVGALALLLSHEPNLSADAAIARLLASGTQLSTLQGVVSSSRMLNAAQLLSNTTTPIANPEPVESCDYAASAIGFNPDSSADQQNPIMSSVDEYGFTTVTLPFTFPFYGQQLNSIVVSPNGVIYSRVAPSQMDYQNTSSAPLNAIAALHTDLTFDQSGLGVRVASATDHVTIQWYGRNYRQPSGWIKVWATLYQDGTIDSSVQFSDSGIEKIIQSASTIGVSGSTASQSVTYAYNSKSLASNTSVRFSPQCGDTSQPSAASLSRIRVKSVVRGMSGGMLERGKGFLVQLIGSGNGALPLNIGIDGKICNEAATFSLTNGRANLHGRLGRRVGAHTISFSSQGVSGRAKISGSKRRLSTRGVNNLCAQLSKTLH